MAKQQKNIRLLPRLLDEIAREAERAGESETTLIEAALERELERRENPLKYGEEDWKMPEEDKSKKASDVLIF